MIKNAVLLFRLRWVAISFQVLALTGAIALKLPVNISLFLFNLGIQCIWNVFFIGTLHKKSEFSEGQFFFQLLFDLIALNFFMLASGGLGNPFSGLFLMQAVLAAMLLSRLRLGVMITFTGLSYTILLLGFNPSSVNHRLWMEFHIQGMIINHILTTIVVGYFVYRIVCNLRQKDRQLSAQKSLIGAGATAAQIAHKLGTPLNKIALIVEDLSEQRVSKDRGLLLSEIITCKTYLSQFFDRLHMSESSDNLSGLSPFFDFLFSKNKAYYPALDIDYTVINDTPISAMALELIGLLLDVLTENAAEAGAKQLKVSARFTKQTLVLQVFNDGPPLPEEIQLLMRAGYSKKEGIAHTGMGLYLAYLCLENLGASIHVLESPNVDLNFEFSREILVGL